METRKLGELTVSAVGLGCNNFGQRIDEAATAKVVQAALDAGITLFDTADIYGGTRSEQFLGKALAGHRDEAVIATKFGAPLGEGKAGAKPEYVRAACDESLRRLGIDCIDLYQLHMPDQTTPIADTLGALSELVDAGKVRQIGCSNFTSEMIEAAEGSASEKGTARFVSVQNQLNLLNRRGEEDLVDACTKFGLGILPYFPLASGMLTGKYKRGEEAPEGTRLAGMPEERKQRVLNDETFDIVERLEAYAESRGHTMIELAMSWLAGMPAMASVIAGATKPDQVLANAESANWKMTDDERSEISEIATRPARP